MQLSRTLGSMCANRTNLMQGSCGQVITYDQQGTLITHHFWRRHLFIATADQTAVLVIITTFLPVSLQLV